MNSSESKRLRDLADAVLSNTASSDEFSELSRLLKDHPEIQDAYLDYVDVHALLSWEYRGQSEGKHQAADQMLSANSSPPLSTNNNVSAQTTNWKWVAVFFTLSAAILLAVTLSFRNPISTTDSSISTIEKSLTPSQGFYEITQTAGAVWSTDMWNASSVALVGEKLAKGKLNLKSGAIEITFENGVRGILAGPCELEIIDPMHVWLHQGRVVFDVPPAAIGFTLETTEANVMDLGTEFGVSAGTELGTEVQVFQGEVVAQVKSNDNNSKEKSSENLKETKTHRLQGGQAVRIGTDSHSEELNFWPDRFVRYLPDPNDSNSPHDAGKRKVSPYNKAKYDELHIVPAPEKITIDGSLEDWDLSGSFASDCEPPYDSFYHVEGAMMYDDQFLYIAAKVGDPFPLRSAVSPHEKKTLYGKGGCLAFRISTDRELGWPVQGEGRGTQSVRKLVPRDYNDKLMFLVLWYYEPEQLACLNIKYGMDQHNPQVNPKGYQGVYQKHADGWGYTAEYAIPWELLNAKDDPPQAGDILGCTWLVHWAGPDGRSWKGQLIDIVNPKETDWNFQNAATWGRAIYHHQGNLPPNTVKTFSSTDNN